MFVIFSCKWDVKCNFLVLFRNILAKQGLCTVNTCQSANISLCLAYMIVAYVLRFHEHDNYYAEISTLLIWYWICYAIHMRFMTCIGSHPDEASVKHMGMVWDLCVALWGNMPEFQDTGNVLLVSGSSQQ